MPHDWLKSRFTQAGCGYFLTGVSNKTNYDTLVLSFQTDRDRIRVGEIVHMRFTVTNQGDTWVLESKDTPVMDIVVQVVGGPDLFTWSAQNPDKVAHRLEWKPGESKTIELVWIPKPEDIASGYYKDILLTGVLYYNSNPVKSAGATVCASNFCR